MAQHNDLGKAGVILNEFRVLGSSKESQTK